MKKETIAILCILALATGLRLWKLGIVPDGITHDELGYVYNAFSISQTGRNVFGEFLPFITWVNIGGFPFLPVPIYLSAPFFWIFGLSTTIGRLPSALMGIADVFLLYLLVQKLFKNKLLALLSALFLAISPWHLHFSRSAYDPNYSLFFYLLGAVVYLKEMEIKRLPFFSTVIFLLALFSYRGMNAIFIPVYFSLLVYAVKVIKITRKQILGSLVGVLIVIFCLFTVAGIYGKPYYAEALSSIGGKMQEDIDQQSKEAQGPLLVKRIFLNKPAYLLFSLRENYIKGYSPEYFFLYTEPSKIYSIWSRGRVYSLDLLFIIFGFVFLYKLNKQGFYLTLGMVLFGGLPGMIGGMPYSARNFFVSAFLPILTAGGVLFFYKLAFLKKWRSIVFFVLLIAYSYLFAGYLFDYYERYAFYARESWVGSLKDVSRDIIENKGSYKKIVVGTSSFGDFMQYAFYAKVDPSRVQKAWKSRYVKETEDFSLDNVTFSSGCLIDSKEGLLLLQKYKPMLFFVHDSCRNEYKMEVKKSIKDYFGNKIWNVYDIK